MADKLADEGARDETPSTSKSWRPEDCGFCEFRRNTPTNFTSGKNGGAFLFGSNAWVEVADDDYPMLPSDASMDSRKRTRGRTRKFVDLVENDGTEEVREIAGAVPTIYEMQGGASRKRPDGVENKDACIEQSCPTTTQRRWTSRKR